MRDEWAEYHEIMAKGGTPSTPSPQSHLNGSSQQNSLPPMDGTNATASALSRLKNAAVNSRIEEMEERLQRERDVIPKMITTGTVTLVYAPSGAGKTVWILGNLFQSIDNGLIRGEDVIYFNEDDGARGVIQKAKLGDQRGMTMVTLSNSNDPSLKNTEDALRLLNLIRMEGEADGKIVICDTLKKFAPVLNKGDMRNVLHVFREFAASGGTVILLGHCNKHRTLDGRLVYEGVGDLKADVDNMFGLDPLNDKYAAYQELLVINEKDRSQVSFKGGFKYKQTSQLIDYEESVASVQFLGEDDIDSLSARQKAQVNIAKAKAHYEDEFYFLKAAMKCGKSFSQSDLYRVLYDEEMNPNECTKKSLRNCMKLLQGNYLQMERIGQYNAKYYKWVTY